MYMPTRVYKTSEIPKKCSPFLKKPPPQKKKIIFSPNSLKLIILNRKNIK